MHLGSFDDEPATVAIMDAYLEQNASFVVIYCISLFFDRFLSLTVVAHAFRGIQVCVIYLILSAGLKMRLRALHIFTGRLPQVEAAGRLPEIGDDTETALRCGAVRGIIAEIRDMAAIAGPEAQILLTGGDSLLLYENLDTSMQRRTAVVPDLVARGLLSIFRYNENN